MPAPRRAAQAAEGAVRAGIAAGGGAALPAPVFNLRKRFEYTCALAGERRSVVAGRMECTMQVPPRRPAPLRGGMPGPRAVSCLSRVPDLARGV